MLPVKRTRIVDSITQRLLNEIVNSKAKPGDKLASERDLANCLNVSRNVLREAIKKLEALDIVYVRQGSGTYVSDKELKNIESYYADIMPIGASFLELIEARQAIEVMAASLSAQRASIDDRENMSSKINEMRSSVNLIDEYARLDFEFHKTIIQSSKNLVLMKLFLVIQDQLKEQLKQALSFSGIPESSLDYHIRIMNAINERDPKLAANEMEGHLSAVTYSIIRNMTE